MSSKFTDEQKALIATLTGNEKVKIHIKGEIDERFDIVTYNKRVAGTLTKAIDKVIDKYMFNAACRIEDLVEEAEDKGETLVLSVAQKLDIMEEEANTSEDSVYILKIIFDDGRTLDLIDDDVVDEDDD